MLNFAVSVIRFLPWDLVLQRSHLLTTLHFSTGLKHFGGRRVPSSRMNVAVRRSEAASSVEVGWPFRSSENHMETVPTYGSRGPKCSRAKTAQRIPGGQGTFSYSRGRVCGNIQVACNNDRKGIFNVYTYRSSPARCRLRQASSRTVPRSKRTQGDS